MLSGQPPPEVPPKIALFWPRRPVMGHLAAKVVFVVKAQLLRAQVMSLLESVASTQYRSTSSDHKLRAALDVMSLVPPEPVGKAT